MKLLKKVENSTIIVLFLAGTIVSLLGVFIRYFSNHSQHWTFELSMLFLLAAIFVGFGTALRDDEHIAVDIVYDRMVPKVQKFIDLFAILVGSLFSLFFIISGSQITIRTFHQELLSPDLGIPVWITYLILPIGGLMLFIHYINIGYRLFFKSNIKDGEE